MLPCIKESSLGIFSATADQRYIIGEDVFFRTHFPISMKRFRPGGEVVTWTEGDLLRELTSTGGDGISGNRTFVLYGAAGSGKSEMVRWLECSQSRGGRRPYVLRISRTELDPVKILQKILGHFKGISLDDSISHHWEDLRKKPVTLANHLVWSALGKMFPSDEEIIPISYRLRPIIEQNLRLNFSGIDNPGDLEGRTPELISLEDLEELARECSLNFDLNCSQLRYLMAQELEQSVLGGYNFVATLKAISSELMARVGIRPLLLIDDLVQSLNIYSTDLLDFFITMEEGSWDIVLGLTPASFESSRQGRETLGRIAALDTFDDRLIKLWLTDEQGHDSYFIDTGNCHLFAEKYLLEVKGQGGYKCGGSCALVHSCTALQGSLENSPPSLAPFNRALLARIYRSLPRDKGKARYFINAIGEILRGGARGDFTAALEAHVRREISVDHPDPQVRLVAETYAPGSAGREGLVRISGQVLAILLGRPEGACRDMEVRATSLTPAGATARAKLLDPGEETIEIDPSKAAVRDWLEGRPTNKELLKGLRLGLAFLCRELAQPCGIMPPNTSRLSPQMRWDETVEGSKVPVSLEGLDHFGGIMVPRSLGHTAYQINNIHLKKGGAREEALAGALLAEEVHCVARDAQEFRESLCARLEGELGLHPRDFAYLLFMLLMEVGQEGREVPPTFNNTGPSGNFVYPGDLDDRRVLFPEPLAAAMRSLFKDWFLLRENVYDAIGLAEYKKKYGSVDPLLEIAKLSPGRISPTFKLAEFDLDTFVAKVQGVINELTGLARGEKALRERDRAEEILGLLGELQHPGAHAEIQGLVAQSAARLDLPQPFIPDWQACHKLQARIRRKLRLYLGRGGQITTETPATAHRFLLTLGDLGREPEYVAIMELCRFGELALNTIQDAPGALLAAAERSGVAGHLAMCQNWGKNTACSSGGRWGLDKFSQLARAASNVAGRWEYLRTLETAAPYMDHQLAGEARATADILESTLDLGLPLWFAGGIQEALHQCREYIRAMDTMLRWHGDGMAQRESHAVIRDTYQMIGDEKLQGILLEIYRQWRSYLNNYAQLARCLAPGDGQAGLAEKTSANLGLPQGDLGAAVIAKFLYGAATHMIEITSEGQLTGGAVESCRRLLDLLLAPRPQAISLSDMDIKELGSFAQKYPALAGSVKVKLYLSH